MNNQDVLSHREKTIIRLVLLDKLRELKDKGDIKTSEVFIRLYEEVYDALIPSKETIEFKELYKYSVKDLLDKRIVAFDESVITLDDVTDIPAILESEDEDKLLRGAYDEYKSLRDKISNSIH